MSTLTDVPLPRSLSTEITPRSCRTVNATVVRPRPVPLALVVNIGSKMRDLVSGAMPTPVSVTVSFACGCAPSLLAGPDASTTDVSMRNTPPPGIASRAFNARFKRTRSRSLRSAMMVSGSLQSASRREMRSPASAANVEALEATTEFASSVVRPTVRGSLAVRRSRVRATARSAARISSTSRSCPSPRGRRRAMSSAHPLTRVNWFLKSWAYWEIAKSVGRSWGGALGSAGGAATSERSSFGSPMTAWNSAASRTNGLLVELSSEGVIRRASDNTIETGFARPV